MRTGLGGGGGDLSQPVSIPTLPRSALMVGGLSSLLQHADVMTHSVTRIPRSIFTLPHARTWWSIFPRSFGLQLGSELGCLFTRGAPEGAAGRPTRH